MAASGIDVWNPAFDVTPGELITGIVTEHGVAYKEEGRPFDIRGFLKSPGARPPLGPHEPQPRDDRCVGGLFHDDVRLG